MYVVSRFQIPLPEPYARISLWNYSCTTVAIAILSFYGGIAVLFKIKSALTRKPAVVEVAKPAVTEEATTGFPSIESVAFEKFLETSAFEKLLENEDQLAKLAESA